MHLAIVGLVRARWTDAIQEEWIRNLLADGRGRERERLERTRDLMNQAIPDCLVAGYEARIPALHLPDPEDRHVLAAAIEAEASVIVTLNLKDFPPDALTPHGIVAQHPDEFICDRWKEDPDRVCLAAQRQRANLKNPPKSVEEFLQTLEDQGLMQAVALLRTRAADL
jgi:hypothetical protein